MSARTLIVTGATRGLGAAIAQRAHAAGYRVIGVSRTGGGEIGGEPIRACNVSDEARLSEVLDDLRKDESLYGVVNAAGVASMNLAITTPPATVRRIIDTNLIGAINISVLTGKWLARRKTGRIINFSTIAVSLGLEGESIYAASKAGLEGFSRAFAREMAPFNVTVNCVAPGPIATDLIRKVPGDKITSIVNRQIIQKQAETSDVWDAVWLLLSAEARMVTGEVIHIGGI